MSNEIDHFVGEIYNAVRNAFLDLFKNRERYYYCVLLTTGEAHPPYISAWSWEALARESEKMSSQENTIKEQMNLLKYSYADSPYCLYGYDDYFNEVVEMFDERPAMDFNDEGGWNIEFNFRYNAMVSAIKMLDDEGLFSLNQTRSKLLLNVEVMDESDVLLVNNAKLFNNSEAAINDYANWCAQA
ncbi:hypothetical protein AGMMS49545_23680 [Betaproteobacteria bacterium]|nr:hypothetical protein AGMMS49545_23680 [Betaproteobacteria bacterium]GHU49512.1 hypothetical protein AGMMS50289_26550 [Betaproteobacteria bacterium]